MKTKILSSAVLVVSLIIAILPVFTMIAHMSDITEVDKGFAEIEYTGDQVLIRKKGAEGVPMLNFKVTAPRHADLVIDQLVFNQFYQAIGTPNEVLAVYLYKDPNMLLDKGRIVNPNTLQVTFSELNLVIPAGTSEYLTLRVGVAHSDANEIIAYSFGLDETSIIANFPFQGKFPIYGYVIQDSEYPTTPLSYQCNDGLDNDSDGYIDYPNDLGCSSAVDDTEYHILTNPAVYQNTLTLTNHGQFIVEPLKLKDNGMPENVSMLRVNVATNDNTHSNYTNLTQITFQEVGGGGSLNEIVAAYLFDGDEMLDIGRMVNPYTRKVIFTPNLIIPSGTSKDLTLKIAFASSKVNGYQQFAIVEKKDIVTTASTIEGIFPIEGNIVKGSSSMKKSTLPVESLIIPPAKYADPILYSSCVWPKDVRLGVFDSRFYVSKQDFVDLIKKAIEDIEKEVGQDMLNYNQDCEQGSQCIVIDMVYNPIQEWLYAIQNSKRLGMIKADIFLLEKKAIESSFLDEENKATKNDGSTYIKQWPIMQAHQAPSAVYQIKVFVLGDNSQHTLEHEFFHLLGFWDHLETEKGVECNFLMCPVFKAKKRITKTDIDALFSACQREWKEPVQK